MEDQDPEIGPTIRHNDPPKPFEFAVGDSENIDAISAHIEKWVGTPDTVFHELVSDKVHIDVHIVKPSTQRPYYTLVTSGMSDRRMKGPEEHPEFAYSELFLCLPPDWKMSQEEWKDEANYWPIQALKFLARFPHMYETWLWYGHTIPNGDPPEPFNASTRLSAFILYSTFSLPSEFQTLKINDEKTIHFFSAVPLYQEELAFKLRKGAGTLEERFRASCFSEVLDPNRPSCIQKGGFFSRILGR
jgi:hypothetical protein